MKPLRMPRALHDVLGHEQSAASLALIGLAMPLAVIAVLPALLAVEPWRAVLASLLVADAAAGAVANVTRGTNDYYRASARRRAAFLAVHVHLPIMALLLDLPLVPALVAWVLTITAGAIIAAFQHRELHKPAAVLAVVVVLSACTLMPDTTVTLLFITALFTTKIVLAFAVDHSGTARDGGRHA